jgi:DNA-binding beta-propeller fold protein YncE
MDDMLPLLSCRIGLVMLVAIAALQTGPRSAALAAPQPAADQIPLFELDRSWPRPLPNDWAFGEAWGIAVDSRDHPWVLHSTNHKDPSIREMLAKQGKRLAPPVVELDAQGNVVQAWGGPGQGYSWMEGQPWAEHGMFIDYKDNVWVTGDGHVALKFTRQGKFVLQLGELWKTNGSNDTRLLGKPTTLAVDRVSNEVFVADGYTNQRVIVFDAETGAYKRHWGAYGKRPDDGPREKLEPQGPPPQRFDPVHCVRIANDGLVYVCDRWHNRFQVFRKDGTFVREVFVDRDVPAPYEFDLKKSEYVARRGPGVGNGSASMAAFSPDREQRYLYIGSSTSYRKIYIYRRSDLQLLGSVDTVAGHHEMAVDSKGNIYTTDGRSRTPMRYLFKGFRPIKSSR